MKKFLGLEGQLGRAGFAWRYVLGKIVSLLVAVLVSAYVLQSTGAFEVNAIALGVEFVLLGGVFMRRFRQVGLPVLWWGYPVAGVVYSVGLYAGWSVCVLAGLFVGLLLVLGGMFSKGRG